jgi:hypothetical protein
VPSLINFVVEKQEILRILSEPVALIIQHEKRMHHTVLPSVAYLTVQHFPTLPQKRHDFQQNI